MHQKRACHQSGKYPEVYLLSGETHKWAGYLWWCEGSGDGAEQTEK